MYLVEVFFFLFILFILLTVLFLMSKKIKNLEYERESLDEQKIICLKNEILEACNSFRHQTDQFFFDYERSASSLKDLISKSEKKYKQLDELYNYIKKELEQMSEYDKDRLNLYKKLKTVNNEHKASSKELPNSE